MALGRQKDEPVNLKIYLTQYLGREPTSRATTPFFSKTKPQAPESSTSSSELSSPSLAAHSRPSFLPRRTTSTIRSRANLLLLPNYQASGVPLLGGSNTAVSCGPAARRLASLSGAHGIESPIWRDVLRSLGRVTMAFSGCVSWGLVEGVWRGRGVEGRLGMGWDGMGCSGGERSGMARIWKSVVDNNWNTNSKNNSRNAVDDKKPRRKTYAPHSLSRILKAQPNAKV
jgi:hypothetical protein